MSNMRGTALPEDQTNITFSFFTTPYFFSTSIPQIPKDLEKNVVVLFFKVFLKNTYLIALSLSRGMWKLSCRPLWSSSLTRDVTWAPWLGSMDLSHWTTSSVQFSSVAHSCRTLCDYLDCSMPGFPVYHQLLELAQIQVCWVGDAIQPSHPLSSPSPSAFNLSQHQGLSQWVSSLQQVAKVLEFQLQHQSFQWTPKTDLL